MRSASVVTMIRTTGSGRPRDPLAAQPGIAADDRRLRRRRRRRRQARRVF